MKQIVFLIVIRVLKITIRVVPKVPSEHQYSFNTTKQTTYTYMNK